MTIRHQLVNSDYTDKFLSRPFSLFFDSAFKKPLFAIGALCRFSR
jgi:hypothetical protein